MLTDKTVIISGRLIRIEITAPMITVIIAINDSCTKVCIIISLYDFPNVCNVNIRFLFSLTHNCAVRIPAKIIDTKIRIQAIT